MVFPLVSGTKKNVNVAPKKQTAAYNQNVPLAPKINEKFFFTERSMS